MAMASGLRKDFAFIGIFAILFPAFYSVVGTSGAIIINAIVLILSVYSIILKHGHTARFSMTPYDRRLLGAFFIVFFLLLFHIPISTAIGALFNNFPVVIRDSFELHRPFFYASVFSLAFFSFQSREDLEGIDRYLLIIFLGLGLLGINQYLRISDTITDLYTKHHNAITRRLSAPFINPYDYAFVMMLFVYYFFFRFLYGNRRFVVLFIFAVALFVLTQSRSMTIGLLFGLLVLIPTFMVYVNRKSLFMLRLTAGMSRYLIVSFVGIVVFSALVGYLITNFSYLTKAFVTIIENRSISIDSSTSIRQEQFNTALKLAIDNPLVALLGNGAAKEKMEFVESMYTYYLFRYGVLGFILYFLIPLLLGLRLCLSCINQIRPNDTLFPLYAAVLIWLLCLPICSIGNNLTEQVRVSFIYYSSLGIVAKSASILRP